MKKFLISFFICLMILIGILSIIFYFYAKPKITLRGEEIVNIKLNEKYNDAGSIATLFDFDISKNIRVKSNINVNKTGEYEVIYEVNLDYLKNSAVCKRKVIVVDSDSPIIKLVGGDIKIYQGNKYKEPGYEAIDNYDGNITDKVKIVNKINTNKVGKYTITYSVKDSSDNIVYINRNVSVIERPTTTTTTDALKNGDNTNIVNNKGTSNGIAILMYHYFYDKDKGEVGKDSNWMEVHDFEKQLKYLQENDYYFPSWQEVADFIDGKITLPKKSIVITIDDGHKSLFTYAIPLIEKYNVKATAFIITNKSAANKFKNFKSENMNFQSHTHNMHQGGCSGGHGGLFRCINYDDGLKDLKTSISILGSNDAIAYPYGDVTNNVIKITKDANFKVGVTTKYGKAKKGMDRLQLPRVRMYQGITLNSFKNSI